MNNTREIVQNGITIRETNYGAITLRELPRHKGYWAGDDGHIYSTKKGAPNRLKQVLNKKLRMWYVTLYRAEHRYMRTLANGTEKCCVKPEPFPVHVLVASVWLPAKPSPSHEIDHEDEDRGNNRPSNLRWLTKIENTVTWHSRRGVETLSDRDIRAIRELRGKMGIKRVARAFGRCTSVIDKIQRRITYKHVT